MSVSNLFSKIRLFFQDRRKLVASILLVLVLLLGAFLRFYHLGASGVGNTYYAATVKSMLTSWHNFFFAAFEPGGSVSVDKPPLGFWVQAFSAYFLGVTGFALALPNAIAGVLSIFVVYILVRRPFGPWAGLVAALALAVMPAAISTERNNTIDGLLVCVLLLAAWAFLQSVYTGKLRWLFLGAFIVGLGFNIKMLQAFLPLPAFYAVYFFGAKRKWWKKLLDLATATIRLLVVSFSWAIAVDVVPAADRPYVDSTSKNTVMELIFGHNGIERLTNYRQRIGLDGGQDGLFAPDGSSNNPPQNGLPNGGVPQPPSGQTMPPAGLPNGNSPQPPAGQGFPQGPNNSNGFFGPRNNGGQSGGPGGSMDFGSAGSLRLFTQPLVGEASWLLPFTLGGLIILVLALWKHPFDEKHVSVILWAAWLLPEAIYFTYSTGLMHAYYLIMLGAPVAALTAMTAWAARQLIQKRALLGWSILFLLTAGTLAFQIIHLWGTTSVAPWAIGAAGSIFGLGVCFCALSLMKFRFTTLALGLLLATMLVAPSAWSVLTTFNSSPNGALPSAGPAGQGTPGGMFGRGDGNGSGANRMLPRSNFVDGNGNQSLLNYLLANTQPGTYLLATGRASDAATYILATGRPVLTFGGFLGQYDEVSVDQLASLVNSGQLRFVLGGELDQHQAIAQWVKQNCNVVDVSSFANTGGAVSGAPGGPQQTAVLYDCRN
jgi:4-amino-4-deoxy-L-arabinose transferase-like glycosyltransferase